MNTNVNREAYLTVLGHREMSAKPSHKKDGESNAMAKHKLFIVLVHPT